MSSKEEDRVLLMLMYGRISKILRIMCYLLCCVMLWLTMWFNGNEYILYMSLCMILYTGSMILCNLYEKRLVRIALEILRNVSK